MPRTGTLGSHTGAIPTSASVRGIPRDAGRIWFHTIFSSVGSTNTWRTRTSSWAISRQGLRTASFAASGGNGPTVSRDFGSCALRSRTTSLGFSMSYCRMRSCGVAGGDTRSTLAKILYVWTCPAATTPLDLRWSTTGSSHAGPRRRETSLPSWRPRSPGWRIYGWRHQPRECVTGSSET